MAKQKVKLPSTAVGRRRLLKLADLLEKDAANKKGIKFDLTLWGFADDLDEPISCGTTACAMGLAVASGAFVRAGLLPMTSGGKLIPRFGEGLAQVTGERAAAKLFQISTKEAGWLFLPDQYGERLAITGAGGERNVAKRIRNFVAGKAAPPTYL